MIRISEKKQDKILNAIGMKRSMESRGPYYQIALPGLSFQIYRPRESKDPYIEEMDQVYRVSGTYLLHNESGMRLYYSSHESWDGETVDYTLLDLFIITKNGEQKDLINVDFDKKLFYTPDGVIPFSEVEKTP